MLYEVITDKPILTGLFGHGSAWSLGGKASVDETRVWVCSSKRARVGERESSGQRFWGR